MIDLDRDSRRIAAGVSTVVVVLVGVWLLARPTAGPPLVQPSAAVDVAAPALALAPTAPARLLALGQHELETVATPGALAAGGSINAQLAFGAALVEASRIAPELLADGIDFLFRAHEQGNREAGDMLSRLYDSHCERLERHRYWVCHNGE